MMERTDGRIIESDPEASRRLLQSGLGRMMGGGVQLYPLEAAFLAEKGVAQVMENGKPLSVSDILEEKSEKKKKSAAGSFSSTMPSLSDQFLIYRAIRGGGHVVRFSTNPGFWRVLARGVGREHERAAMLVRPVTSEWNASLSSFAREMAAARLLRLELVLAYVENGKAHLVKISKPPIDA